MKKIEQLTKLNELLKDKSISKEEFDTLKKEVIFEKNIYSVDINKKEEIIDFDGEILKVDDLGFIKEVLGPSKTTTKGKPVISHEEWEKLTGPKYPKYLKVNPVSSENNLDLEKLGMELFRAASKSPVIERMVYGRGGGPMKD